MIKTGNVNLIARDIIIKLKWYHEQRGSEVV